MGKPSLRLSEVLGLCDEQIITQGFGNGPQNQPSKAKALVLIMGFRLILRAINKKSS